MSKIKSFRHHRHLLFIIALLTTITLTPLALYITRTPQEVGASWWDEGWAYRKQINFGNSGSPQTNKIISFSQDTATLITDGKMQTSCQDVRFVDNTGRSLEHRIGYQPDIQYVPGSATEYNSTTGASSYTFSHTVSSGSNQLLTVIVHAQDTAAIDVTNVTFNSDSMTEQIEVDNNDGTNHYVTSIWTLVNPDVTSANVQVTYSASVDRHVASAMNFTGVDQTTPVGVVESNTTSSASNIEITDTTSYANSLLVGGGLRKVNETSPSRRLYTQLPGKHVYEEQTGTTTSNISAGGGFQYAETPGSHTMTFGLSNATSDTHMAGAFIELKQAAGCNSGTTGIDVLMPSIISGENAVYMYYGNSSAIAATSLLTDSSKTLAYKEVSSDSNGNNSQFSSLSYSHTVTAGNNQTLVVVVDQIRQQSGDVPVDVASVTYNSKPMVRQVFADGTSTNRSGSTEVWTLLNPDVGNNQVAITLSETSTVLVSAAMTFENTMQNYFPAAGAAYELSSTSFDINITTTKPNTLLAGGGARQRSTTAPNATTATVNVTSPGTRVYHVLQPNTDTSSSISSAGGHQPALSAGVHTMNLTTSAPAQQFMTGALIALEPESSYDTFSPTSGPAEAGEEKGPGPVGYWKFDEGSGTDAFDSISTQNHGTISGAAWQTAGSCIFGPCLLFDGSNDVVTISNTPSIDFDQGLNKAVSVSFWVNPSSDGEGDNGRIFTKGSHLWCRTDSQSSGAVDLECTIDLATTDGTVNVVGGLTIGAWHHVEITYGDDGDDDLLVYINGELRGTGNGSGAPVGTDTSPLLIGGDTGTNYHGYIDDFKIFNYERTLEQVKTDYLKGASAPGSNIAVGIGGTPMPDPVVWWRFDEMNGTTANDATGNSNSGTITSGTWTLNGKIASALVFTASTSVSDTITDPAYTNTISLWVYPTTSAASKTLVTSGKLTTNASSQPTYGGCTGTTLPLATWTHIVAVSNGSGSCTLYQNGIQTSTAGTGVTFGTSLNVGGSSFIGTIDDVKLYNVALTADQVKVDYNATSALNTGTGVNERALHTSGDSYLSSLSTYWSFDENTGTGLNFVKDYSGNNTHVNSYLGTVVWVPGVRGSAVDFNNSWNLYSNPSNFNPGTSDFTYMMWMYLDSRTTSFKYLVTKQDTDAYGFSTTWDPTTNTINSGLRINYSANQSSVSNAGYVDKWAHYAFVYDRDDMLTVYINGRIIGSDSISSLSTADVNNDNNFGMGLSGGSTMYAKLDEFKFFLSALNQSQIAYEYNRGAPLAWYRLDECQGTTINDATGNGFTGTLTVGGSGTYTSAGACSSGTSAHAWNAGTTGKMSSAMAFDGTDDYVSVSDNSTLRFDSGSQDFSLFAWVKRNASGAVHYIVSKEDADNDGYRLQFDSGNTVTCSVDAIDITSTKTITDTDWHHVGCVVDRDGNGQIYIDGLPNGSTTAISSEAMATTTAMRFGSRSYTATNYLNGLLDDVRIYNYAISADQVKSVMNGGVARFE